MSSNLPISVRIPPNLKGKVHADVEKVIRDHDDSIVDLRQANSSLKQQLTTLQQQVAALQKASNG